ncbi:hypothetical protein [Arthrobacter humicola]|uniref:hypothetical protein n=1 Tax=Arthrobacter humicola TaxID=409291 RepID=UPI001FAD81AA|nr:hypothetical protein [Arthrobacter humicola]MCI9872810.1 hypothetical protein [Arthrobacter humicola]
MTAGTKIMTATAALLIAGIGMGSVAAAASISSDAPATRLASEPHDNRNREGQTIFKRNAAGQTYGSIKNVDGVVVEPDLIKALATNGELGYVSNDQLKKGEGHPSLFKSPAEALKWQESQGKKAVSIPVYDEAGTTKIGEFVIAPGSGEVAGG